MNPCPGLNLSASTVQGTVSVPLKSAGTWHPFKALTQMSKLACCITCPRRWAKVTSPWTPPSPLPHLWLPSLAVTSLSVRSPLHCRRPPPWTHQSLPWSVQLDSHKMPCSEMPSHCMSLNPTSICSQRCLHPRCLLHQSSRRFAQGLPTGPRAAPPWVTTSLKSSTRTAASLPLISPHPMPLHPQDISSIIPASQKRRSAAPLAIASLLNLCGVLGENCEYTAAFHMHIRQTEKLLSSEILPLQKLASLKHLFYAGRFHFNSLFSSYYDVFTVCYHKGNSPLLCNERDFVTSLFVKQRSFHVFALAVLAQFFCCVKF